MYLFDTFTNFLSGMGVFGRDKMTASQYVTRIWTREQLESSFRSDWIARKAITIPAFDATREWRAWQAEQDQIEKLEETEQRLGVQLKLQQALTMARLYGGCCMLIGVDGNMEKELKPDSIKKDGLKFLHVLAPHQLGIESIIRDISDPWYGHPTNYTLSDDTGTLVAVKIHPSRMVRLLGLDTPNPLDNFGWGDPLLQMIHDAVNAAGTVASSVATLISEAKLDVIKIPGLTEIFSTENGTERVIKRFTEANVAKSVINGILMDAEEEWQRIGVNFQGMPEILQMYLQIASGACDIPMTRFVGMSPAGLNATGESDLHNYYDRISSEQELRLTPALELLDKAIMRSALGKIDEDIFYEWNSLWQMTEAEKATIAKQKADASKVDSDTGLIPFEALVKGRVNQLIEDGTYPGLEAAIDEVIAADEMPTEPPQLALPAPGAGGAGIPPQPEAIGGEIEQTRDSFRRLLDAFDESKVSRGQPDNAGKFGPGGGSARQEPPSREEKSRSASAALSGKKSDELTKATPQEFVAARDKSTRQQFLSAHPAEELSGHKLMLNKDSTVGISVDAKGDIQNVFNNGGPKGGAAKAMVAAIEAGGNTLDCYAGHLNAYYHQFGFEEDRRMKFDPQYAPEGWDFDKFGTPDIVFMSWRGYRDENGAAGALARAAEGGQPGHVWEWPERSNNYVTDWDEAKDASRRATAEAAPQRGGKQSNQDARSVEGRTADRAGSQPRHRTSAGYRRAISLLLDTLAERFDDAREWDEDLHPRGQPDNAGQFGPGGGGSKDDEREARASGRSDRALAVLRQSHHLGPGYSKQAHIANGVIHTPNVYDAVLALTQDRPVELKQPKQVSTLIKALGEVTRTMIESGEKAPSFDLCKVTVKGTNLFCADTKGIERIKMPQMDDVQTKAFVKYLNKQGYTVTKGVEKSKHLRATQAQLDAAKVNKFYERIKKDKDFLGDDKRLVVSKDDYVLDGHHHWAAQIAADAMDNKLGDHETRVFRVDIPIIPLYKHAMKFTGGKGGKGMGDSLADAFDESKVSRGQPENAGQFGPGGYSAKGEDERGERNEKAIAALQGGEQKQKRNLEPKAIEVGGDQWNKETALRLESEYQDNKPKLEKMLTDYTESDVVPDEPPHDPDADDYDGPPTPDEWDVLSADAQALVEEHFYDNKLSDYLDSEVTNWHETGGALDEAKGVLAAGTDFQHNAVKEWIEENETDTEFPFTALDIADSITLEYDSDGEGGGKLTVEFDDKVLNSFTPTKGGTPEGQGTLPGMDAPENAELLTKDMRLELTTMLKAKFEKEAEKTSGDMEPPEYLKDSAKEYLEQTWSEMSDSGKFEYAEQSTDVIKDIEAEIEATGGVDVEGVIVVPDTYDPLNETSGTNYKLTQRIARTMSIDRAMEVFKERGIKQLGPGGNKMENAPEIDRATLAKIDHDLWDAWKGSSTSEAGKALQVATADELGGRLNPKTGRGGKVQLDLDEVAFDAETTYAKIGGWAGLKAYVRAKWETTQFLLDKAGKQDLELYRGISLDNDKYAEAQGAAEQVKGHERVPTINVLRNGAASTSFSRDVANDWGNADNRIVLRAHVPRTAAVSIPAYGINIKSEQEVVIAGTAWKGWDAWLGKAPRFSDIPLAMAA